MEKKQEYYLLHLIGVKDENGEDSYYLPGIVHQEEWTPITRVTKECYENNETLEPMAVLAEKKNGEMVLCGVGIPVSFVSGEGLCYDRAKEIEPLQAAKELSKILTKDLQKGRDNVIKYLSALNNITEKQLENTGRSK
ncbi:MAG TPA: hypothetical protein PLC53_00295 [Bacilli bacterium]|nr:hypothetical protein [Bacilli bacterium]